MDGISEEIRGRIAERIVRGPFGRHIDLRLQALAEDTCTVRLPYQAAVANGIGVVHGGVISALIDTAATGAAWASPRLGARSRGATAGLTVSYLAPGLETDLAATARVLRRGRALCMVEVDVVDAEGRHVARGLVTYRLRESDPGEETAPAVLGPDPKASSTDGEDA